MERMVRMKRIAFRAPFNSGVLSSEHREFNPRISPRHRANFLTERLSPRSHSFLSREQVSQGRDDRRTDSPFSALRSPLSALRFIIHTPSTFAPFKRLEAKPASVAHLKQPCYA